MLISLAIILLGGFILGFIFEKIKLPKIIGMLIYGILIGSSFLNIIDDSIINISASLRQLALVIILTRAGLSLDIKKLKQIGRPAILLSFVPATFEIIGITIFGPILLGISVTEALLLGSVLAAVSPAIIVPKMIKIKEEGYGRKNNISEIILAGASVDDVYAIILFYSFLGLVETNKFNVASLLNIPISIILGIFLGVLFGLFIIFIFNKIKLTLVHKILILLSFSLILLYFEEAFKEYVSISSLLGVMATSVLIYTMNKKDATEIEEGYNKIWIFFEIILFVLVGASINIEYALLEGFNALLLIFIGLAFRMCGTYLCTLKTKLNIKERLFIVLSYIPKATVQASIGGIALSQGLNVGTTILTVAVLSILISAPIGATLIDLTYKRLLD